MLNFSSKTFGHHSQWGSSDNTSHNIKYGKYHCNCLLEDAFVPKKFMTIAMSKTDQDVNHCIANLSLSLSINFLELSIACQEPDFEIKTIPDES
ncbi:hypothetical protein X798_06116 [Onchocerca flexuosa]|uniref:Uncharacterized protein n=2 Tax=Onchocerca flexuosa TaxID=387005 RepID=A0A183H6L9_9BILA|nr:hypothetical protein X798_06116 [Onchocerca flexuosa]VDO35389.1 unnamed protein product [Onchocerca flexuosa]